MSGQRGTCSKHAHSLSKQMRYASYNRANYMFSEDAGHCRAVERGWWLTALARGVSEQQDLSINLSILKEQREERRERDRDEINLYKTRPTISSQQTENYHNSHTNSLLVANSKFDLCCCPCFPSVCSQRSFVAPHGSHLCAAITRLSSVSLHCSSSSFPFTGHPPWLRPLSLPSTKDSHHDRSDEVSGEQHKSYPSSSLTAPAAVGTFTYLPACPPACVLFAVCVVSV